MAPLVSQVVRRDLYPDFGVVNVFTRLLSEDEDPSDRDGVLSDEVTLDPAAVVFGAYFVRLLCQSSRPTVTMDLWDRAPPPEPDPAPNGRPYLAQATALMREVETISATVTTGGFIGDQPLDVPRGEFVCSVHVTDQSDVQEQERAFWRDAPADPVEPPVDVECWLLRFWPGQQVASSLGGSSAP